MKTFLLADHLALFIVVVLAISAMMRSQSKIIAACLGSPFAIGLYYLLSRLFRAFSDHFGQLAGN